MLNGRVFEDKIGQYTRHNITGCNVIDYVHVLLDSHIAKLMWSQILRLTLVINFKNQTTRGTVQ